MWILFKGIHTRLPSSDAAGIPLRREHRVTWKVWKCFLHLGVYSSGTVESKGTNASLWDSNGVNTIKRHRFWQTLVNHKQSFTAENSLKGIMQIALSNIFFWETNKQTNKNS